MSSITAAPTGASSSHYPEGLARDAGTAPTGLPAAPAIRLSAARVLFEGTALFDGLTLVLPAGRTTCLLGPSGVGKTSLLRMIAGLLAPEDGTVLTTSDGQALTGRIAYMAQTDLLLPWLDVLGNATLGPRLRGDAAARAQARQRATALLQDVGLGDRLTARPDALSGGMRQRVALVRTLVEDRPVVLMDEPFGALDAISRLQLQDLAARLLVGRTVLLVTHDPLEAARLGHRIHVMAGAPATLDTAWEPQGAVPRAATDPGVLATQAELLRRLADATAGGAS
ncbi:ABC transporter ATP-binding protein [Reyranella sp. CPCC 100927]|uniref:ABC transporter ATP-binding protein n=1 Tax=Reyranella sp. CPCC 100927 TaxID=2599616 RepID=UPI0011B7FAF4|nr:ABC transporter ATP-binding protein [Reyranella sp. CPCC 100927]TWT11809.1 ABC transporter ATP-binding protein [Reyranella sp. CPCC 100927]